MLRDTASQTCSGESAFFFITSAEWMGGYKSVRVCIVLKPHNLLHSSFFDGLDLRRGDAIVATTLDTAQISKRYRR